MIWVSPCFGYPHTQIPSEMGIPGRDAQNTEPFAREETGELVYMIEMSFHFILFLGVIIPVKVLQSKVLIKVD